MQDFEGRAKGELLRQFVTFFPQEEIENFPAGKRFCFADKGSLSFHFRNPAFDCGDFRSDERRKPPLFQEPFVAGGDVATVTWSNLPERLKGMWCGVNFKADA